MTTGLMRHLLATMGSGSGMLLFAAPALARGGGCTPGGSNCLQVAGNLPAAQYLGFCAVVFFIGFLLAFMGSWAAHQKLTPEAEGPPSVSTKFLLQLWMEPGWSFEKKLTFGGMAACFVSMMTATAILFAFGTQV